MNQDLDAHMLPGMCMQSICIVYVVMYIMDVSPCRLNAVCFLAAKPPEDCLVFVPYQQWQLESRDT